jgi:hypothetical protein
MKIPTEPPPPVHIPEEIRQLPKGFTWAGNTLEEYPHINNSEGRAVAIIWPDTLRWNGVSWRKTELIPTASYEEGLRLACTLIMLGDE